MNTQDEKLDYLVEKMGALHTDLAVHIAKDEGQWEKISNTEDEIKELTRENGKVKTRTAVIAAVLAAGGSQAFTLLKAFL